MDYGYQRDQSRRPAYRSRPQAQRPHDPSPQRQRSERAPSQRQPRPARNQAPHPDFRPAQRPAPGSSNRPSPRAAQHPTSSAREQRRRQSAPSLANSRQYGARTTPPKRQARTAYANRHPQPPLRSGRAYSGPGYGRKLGGRGSLNPRVIAMVAVALIACFGVFSAVNAAQRHAAEVAAQEQAAAEKKALEKQRVKPSKLGVGAIPFSTPKSAWKQGEMPHLYQTDPAWAQKPYAGSTVEIAGCGPTSLAMVYVYLTGRTDYDPATLCALADDHNFAPTGATEWAFMTEGAAMLGLNSKSMYASRSTITQALEDGKPLIVVLEPGDFTTVGHFIVLKSIDERGMVEVYDPNSALNSAVRWPIMRILPQIENTWAFSA